MSMFGFLDDLNNHEERKVAHYENTESGLVVDTCRVSDGQEPFETAVRHPRYNNWKWVVVESYVSREVSEEGHKRWVVTMTAAVLPSILRDCGNAEIASFAKALLENDWVDIYERGE